MKAVLDTNIIVSAFLNPKGIPAEILSSVLTHKITLYYDNKVLSEYTNVLTRSKFDFNIEFVNDFLDFVKTNGVYVIAEPQNIQFEDEDDKIFYDIFKSSDAMCIITGNKKHYPHDKNILNPREYKELQK